MKKVIVFIVALMCAMGVFAAPPNLACESLFDKKKLDSDITSFVINTSGDSYFRSIRFENNPKLAARIQSMLEKDRARATNVVENYRKERNDLILNIPNNDYIINVCFSWSDDGDGNLFVEGNPKAFK